MPGARRPFLLTVAGVLTIALAVVLFRWFQPPSPVLPPRPACNPPGTVNDLIPGNPVSNPQDVMSAAIQLCFGPVAGGPESEAEDKDHSKLNARLRIRPERRMLGTDADALIGRNQGMVVGAVHNLGNTSPRGVGWRDALKPHQEGYIWFGRDADSSAVAMFFVVERGANPNDRVLRVLDDTGSWSLDVNPAVTRLQARWNHPARRSSTTGDTLVSTTAAVTLMADGGWISCLRGCCPASEVFDQ